MYYKTKYFNNKYPKRNGVAIIKLSKRSSNPPCPGIILPVSFISILRLNIDSTKSPIVPITGIIVAIIIQSMVLKGVSMYVPIRYPVNMQNTNPPIKPSQLFLGECRLKRGCRPMHTPVR